MRFIWGRPARALPGLIAAVLTLSAHATPGENNTKKLVNGSAGARTLPGFSVTGVDPVQNTFSPGMLQVPGVMQVAGSRPTFDRVPVFAPNNKTPSNVGCDGDRNGGGNHAGRPIQISSGTKYETYPIFALPGEMGLAYTLYYNTALQQGANGWADNLTYRLDLICTASKGNGACTYITYQRPDGSSLVFNGTPGAGPFTEQGGGGLATLSYNAASATYTLHDEDATTKTFTVNASGQGGVLRSIMDVSGVGWTVSYGNNGNGVSTTTVTHTNGQSYTVNTGPLVSTVVNGAVNNAIPINVTDPAGNVYALHNTNNVYDQITLPGSPATVIGFKYVNLKASRLAEVDYNGVPYDYTTYITSPTDPHYQWANGNFLADNSEAVYIAYGTDSAGNLQATVTNALGHQTTQVYDGTNGSAGAYNGQLSLISDAAVSTCASTTHGRTYDVNGNLAETIDNNGNIHTYTYAANGQLQSETEAFGTPLARTTDYVWDANQQLNRLLSVTIEGWKKTSYTYNAQNRLASVAVTNLSGQGSANQTLTTTYGYALYGNGMVQTMVVTSPSPNGSNQATYQYDTLGNLTSVSNGLGQTTTYSQYNGLGEVGHVVGPNGDAVDYTYDARGRVVTKTTHPNGTSATWTYTYDGFGLPATVTEPDGQVTTWNRDATMRVQTVTHNDKDGTSTESFTYDANGDVLEDKVVRGGTVGRDQIFHYDALGRVYQVIGQNGQSVTYAYDGNGNRISATDAVGHTIVSQYDALNRVMQTTESGGASPPIPSAVAGVNLPANLWVPTGSTSNPYIVSWNSVPYATTYVLQQQIDDGTWITVQSSSAISWSAPGQAKGVYRYRVAACDATGCGAWSPAGVFVVDGPAPELPAVLQVILASP